MRRSLALLLVCVLLADLAAFARSQNQQPPAALTTGSQSPPAATQPAPPTPKEPSTAPAALAPVKGFVLEEGTPVKMRINRTVSSGDAHQGDTVDFEVLEDVLVQGTLVIPKGGLAFATVTEAQAKRRMARGGKLDINIDYVKLTDGEKAALRAVKEVKGGGHTGAMTGGIVATSLVFFPAAPFFLFMHGKDISIPKGTEVTAYINGDLKLDPAKFQAATLPAAAPQVTPAASVTRTTAKLQLESTPPGADIELDGGFVGNTPSDVQVPEGEHTVTVKKTGFKDWERKMKVTAGSTIHLNADLEKTANP
jgi:PEGA domain